MCLSLQDGSSLYKYIMSGNFSLFLKAWTYVRGVVLDDEFMCERYLANRLHFTDLGLYPAEAVLQFTRQPLEGPFSEASFTEFWGHVVFCLERLLSHRPFFEVICRETGTGNGLGLKARASIDSKLLCKHIIGPLELCIQAQISVVHDMYHHPSCSSLMRIA
jgi:hypothetical protein